MKIKNGFLLREVAGSYIVVATGALTKSFGGIIKLNETGSFLWKCLSEHTDKDGLVEALTKEYDVSREIAESDVSAFVKTLLDAGVIEE
ncbi:MAG: PqqD family protein [Ruminococcaceae bacterium]|nr:PqqD family protein [Oscillospiraceae bacterium]